MSTHSKTSESAADLHGRAFEAFVLRDYETLSEATLDFEVGSAAGESLREEHEPAYDAMEELESAFKAQLSQELVAAYIEFDRASFRHWCWRRRQLNGGAR